MPTLTLSFAPHTRTADAAVKAPRKNLRVVGSDTARLLFALIVSVPGWMLAELCCREPRGRYGFATATVNGLLSTPLTIVSGSAGPVGVSFGNTTLICHTPASPGASPAY